MRNWSKTVAECKICGRIKLIVNRKYGVCIECNHYRLYGETIIETKRKEALAKREAQVKKKSKPLTTKTKRKPTGEKAMFLEIWSEREHYCANTECRKFLGAIPMPIFFSHRKSKGAYPELRLDKNNIDLLCPTCHYEWDFGNRKNIKLKDDE